jgi:EAL domain-containing protein (putative c-di-GMP-specific phosphodiesterase class I)
MALYRAKEEGRNGFRFFEDSMNDEVQRRLALGQDLHGALGGDEFYLEYQPQVHLRSQRLAGVEALVRWRHPAKGVVGPSEFVPIAESNGLIIPIGEWVLRTACAQARSWQQQGLPAIPVAVNLSGAQLKSFGFVDKVLAILDETGLASRFLELELTETILMQASEALEQHFERLSRHGVRISLDDFGRAYSSLEYLRRFPLSKLKIDQSFVRDIGSNLKDATILSAVISLANKLDIQVVAEGVGPENQVEFLLRRAATRGRGSSSQGRSVPMGSPRYSPEGATRSSLPLPATAHSTEEHRWHPGGPKTAQGQYGDTSLGASQRSRGFPIGHCSSSLKSAATASAALALFEASQ